VVGHVGVNLTGEFDEAGAEVPLFGLPREIERVDGDAVAAQACSFVISATAGEETGTVRLKIVP